MNYKNLFKILVLISTIVSVVYLTYSYYGDSTPKEIPLIEPDNAVTKIKPIDAGGIIIPNSDNTIYENMGKAASVKKINILPEPEQALVLVGQKDLPILEDSIDSMLESLFSNNDDKKVYEIEPIEPVFEEQLISTRVEEIDNTNLNQSQKSLNIVKINELDKKIIKVKNIDHLQEGKFKIQLASMKTQSLAISEGERIKRKHPKVLANVTISQKKVQQDKGHFFYIVLAGDYQNLGRAKAACKKLTARQQSCIIYHP